jgi:hypothetical protein
MDLVFHSRTFVLDRIFCIAAALLNSGTDVPDRFGYNARYEFA